MFQLSNHSKTGQICPVLEYQMPGSRQNRPFAKSSIQIPNVPHTNTKYYSNAFFQVIEYITSVQ